jgi:hypothetical protein
MARVLTLKSISASLKHLKILECLLPEIERQSANDYGWILALIPLTRIFGDFFRGQNQIYVIILSPDFSGT